MTSIRLTHAERQVLLDRYRRSPDPAVGQRAHILLLLDAGHPWATIGAVLFCSASTVSRWKRRFEKEGVQTVLGRPRGRRRSGAHIWATLVVRWVLTLSPIVSDSPGVAGVARRPPSCCGRTTRNHRCQTVQELLDLTFDWFETRTHFRVQSSVYKKCPGE